MIKYNLICAAGHEFDVWFSKSSDFDAQAPKGLIACPHCGLTTVEKAIMAPNISTSRKKDKIAAQQTNALKAMNAAADEIRKEIAKNCDDVGEKFAEEARAIHYGEKPERGIYGKASAKDAADLADEGITALPLPDVLAPKPKKKDLN